MKKKKRKSVARPSSAQQIKKLKGKVTRLKESGDLKDEFISITSHELRTPLDSIRGHIDMVLKGDTGEIPKKTREYLEDALIGADRLTKLVTDILQISRIETGRLKIELKDVNLANLLEVIKKEFMPLTDKKQLSLSFDVPENLPHVLSNSDRLFEIFNNLIGNSLKFTPPGGSIIIRAHAENGTVLISVRDTGIGIRPEDQKKLFKQFPQIDENLALKQKGAGLGLALVHKFIEKLGGKIWVESAGLRKGTTFFFQLPRSNA